MSLAFDADAQKALEQGGVQALTDLGHSDRSVLDALACTSAPQTFAFLKAAGWPAERYESAMREAGAGDQAFIDLSRGYRAFLH